MPVSVIVAAYNCEQTIERALMSALAQTWPVVEIIVVDDVSTDGTRSIVRSMAETDPRILLVESKVNQGPSGARNLGIRFAKGDWIAVLDADDAWSHDRLQVMRGATSRIDADIVADNQLFYDAGAQQVTRFGFSPDRGTRWIKPIDVFEQDVQLGAEFSYGILKPIIRRSFLEAHGLTYDEKVRYGEDLLFLAEMMLSGARAMLIPEPLYIYTTRVGDRSGMASPHSRSIPRFDLFADGIMALKTKYDQTITADIGYAMTRLSKRFRLVHGSNLAREQRKERGLLAYALYVGQHPPVLTQVLRQRVGHLKRHIYSRSGSSVSAPRLLLLQAIRRVGPADGSAMQRTARVMASLAFAAALVTLSTLARSMLSPQMQSQSPFLIYVAPLIVGTLLMGPLCGALVIAGGSLTALYVFVAPLRAWSVDASVLGGLPLFWFTGLSVLLSIAALRRRMIEQGAEELDGGLRYAEGDRPNA